MHTKTFIRSVIQATFIGLAWIGLGVVAKKHHISLKD